MHIWCGPGGGGGHHAWRCDVGQAMFCRSGSELRSNIVFNVFGVVVVVVVVCDLSSSSFKILERQTCKVLNLQNLEFKNLERQDFGVPKLGIRIQDFGIPKS